MNKLRRTEEKFPNPEHTVESPGGLLKINLWDSASRESFQSVPGIFYFTLKMENQWVWIMGKPLHCRQPFFVSFNQLGFVFFCRTRHSKKPGTFQRKSAVASACKTPSKVLSCAIGWWTSQHSTHHPGRDAWPYFLHKTKHPLGKINHHVGATLWPHGSHRSSRFLPTGSSQNRSKTQTYMFRYF